MHHYLWEISLLQHNDAGDNHDHDAKYDDNLEYNLDNLAWPNTYMPTRPPVGF